jgi:RimJ/RimL family protein N-acetyltransferase
MLVLEPISTPRLVLAPVSPEVADAIVAGDLTAVTPAAGWPHENTEVGLRMARRGGHAPGWFVTLDDHVIGDCGVHGEADASGAVEVGFGLAEPYRRRGYGTELVLGIVGWLCAQDGITRVFGRTVANNIGSQKVMERAGLTADGDDGEYLTYSLAC